MVFASRCILASRRQHRGRLVPADGMLTDGPNQFVPFERFAVVGDASKDGAPASGTISRQHDDRDVPKARVEGLLDTKRSTVHDRHAEIEEDEAGDQAVA
jgi:hypothetical protein